MCGICGFLSRGKALGDETLRAMNASIRRRGPDGEGYYRNGPVALAMRRLAIIDLEGGQQPVFNEDRTVAVVFNGEIYNYKRLRAELTARGHRFATHSDTEVIAHLYEDYGDEFVGHLRGMFAIALWDTQAQRLVLARDRLGIKPLYVAETADALYFGSELKAVLAGANGSRALDWSAVDQYFAYTFIPQPASIYSGVLQLESGTIATAADGALLERRRYWSLPSSGAAGTDRHEWESEVEHALLRAVESHLVSDVPVGAFLSGGVDSSVIVAMMASFTDKPVQAFTVGFTNAGGAFLDERQYARELAKRYAVEHHEIEVNPDAAAILPEVVEAFDQPFADDSVIPSYYVSQATARTVKVAMTGLGGDELFGGYRRHLGTKLAGVLDAVPAFIRTYGVAPLLERVPESRRALDWTDHLKRFVRAASLPPADRYADYLITQPYSERMLLFTAEARARMAVVQAESIARSLYESCDGEDALDRALRTDLVLYLPDDILTLTDRLSMWHSLELRVPFLDHPLVELVVQAPTRLKIRRLEQKALLRRIAARWVPQSILHHRKQGFEAPMGSWLRGPLLPLLESLLSQKSIEQQGIFDHARIRRLIDEHVAGRRKHSKLLFALIMFQLWWNAMERGRAGGR
jgi:asparagine synthase (glutamine-hydrolysing)